MGIRFAWWVLALAAASPVAHAHQAQVHRYQVSIAEGAKVAHVEAELLLATPGVSLFGVMPTSELPNGQADLLENLTATDVTGKPLAVENLGEGDFRLSAAGRVRLRYDVRLEHDAHTWPAGAEEVAYRAEDGLVATGSAFFLAPTDATPHPAEVRFLLPEGWRAVTPWEPTAEPGTYLAPTRRELASNAFYLGTPRVEQVRTGGVQLTLALGRSVKGRPDLFVELLSKQLASYRELFGGPPRSSRYLLIINRGESGDGGAFASSFSQFLQGEPTAVNRVIWGHVMAHELLHFWNGLSMAPVDSREEWFKEGVTDYLTLTTLARNGLTDAGALRERLANINRRVVLARLLQGLTVTVREAGEKKQEHRLLVYGGGSAAALALDVELRKRTKDAKGLPDLMRALFAEFGSGDKRYTLADVERVAAGLTGSDFRDFFARTVESPQAFDLRPVLSEIGLRLDAFYEEQFVAPDAAATAAQRRRYRAIFGGAKL